MSFFAHLLTPLRLVLPVAFGLLALRGCPGEPGKQVEEKRVHPAVVVRRVPVGDDASYVRVIDADLSGARIEIAAEDIARRQNRITGRARSVADWVEHTGAMAGVNGGFFGEAAGPEHLEIVGLLKVDGRVRSAGPTYHSRSSGADYARSAFGIDANGRPRISWVTSRRGDPQALFSHAGAELHDRGTRWSVREAVACGPRLIREGAIEVSYRGERLASPGALPRTFLGFSDRRVVLAAATGMEFSDCAAFMKRYFREAHGEVCREAMALDGGASTQAAWRENGAIRTDSPLNIEVPTALLVHAR